MFKHVYKPGGDWSTEDGVSYTIKAVNLNEVGAYVADGWFKSLDDVILNAGRAEEDQKLELRNQIKALGGKPKGRTIETLTFELEQLQNDDTNEG